MSGIRVNIEVQGFIFEDSLIPDDYTPELVISEMVDQMSLPHVTETGEPISYSLLHVNQTLTLPKGKLLSEAGVRDGDTVRVVPSHPYTRDHFSRPTSLPAGDGPHDNEVKVILSVLDLNKTEQAVFPRDRTVGEIISSIAANYGLPPRDKLGALIRYRLMSKALGRFLSLEETLNQAGVPLYDRLSLHREEVAGCFPETAKALLPSGDTAPIGELKSRDVVLAYDLEAGGYVPGEVEGIYQQTYSERLIINDLLITTPDQHSMQGRSQLEARIRHRAGGSSFNIPFQGSRGD
jgi:hypothetical protein